MQGGDDGARQLIFVGFVGSLRSQFVKFFATVDDLYRWRADRFLLSPTNGTLLQTGGAMPAARAALTILLTASVGAMASPTSAASFDVVAQKDSGDWSAVLYRNQSSARLFCALESQAGGTVFRVVRYKDANDTFLEIHNPSWSLMEGRSTFAIDFTIKGEAYTAELAGQRYSDAYVHDLTENQTYLTLLGAIASASSMKVTNPNGTTLTTLRGLGSKQALDDFGDCVSSN